MAVITRISIVAGLSLLLGLVKAPNAGAANDPPEAKQVDAVFTDLVKPGSPGCALAGDYVSDELFVTYTLSVEKGKLFLAKIKNGASGGFLQATQHFELRPVGNEKFLQDAHGIRLEFVRGPKGEVSGFVLGVGRSSGITFSKK